MHEIEVRQEIERADGTKIPEGFFVADDLNAAELITVGAAGTVRCHHMPHSSTPFERSAIGNFRGAKVLIVHNGGFGDQLMIEPVIRAIAACEPADIAFACRERVRCILNGHPNITRFVEYPVPSTDWQAADVVLCGENIVEATTEGHTMHATDAKANVWKVPFDVPAADKCPRLYIAPSVTDWAREHYPKRDSKGRGPVPRIGIQLRSSSITRDYPPAIMGSVMEELYVRGYELMLFGSPGSIPTNVIPPNGKGRIHNLTQDRLSFIYSAAVLQTCDVVLCPDSAIMHVAGALRLPCVAIFGPINPELRTRYYPTVRALTSDACAMAPCNHHARATGNGFLAWPKNGPCTKVGYCVSTAGVQPSAVVQAVRDLVHANEHPTAKDDRRDVAS